MTAKPIICDLVLASGSAIRAELLGRLGLPFVQDSADIDETPMTSESPRDLAERLAREKALAVTSRHPGACVIGSDQVAVFHGEPTGKPGTAARARAALERFSGGEVTFVTGVRVLCPERDFDAGFIDTTVVKFRHLDAGEIERYVDRDDPTMCAGSFKVESLGPSLFEWVRSEDPTGLPGLPLIRLAALLREAGYVVP